MTDKVDPTKRPLPAGALQLAPAVEATAPTTRTRLAAPGATSFESDLLRFGDPALQRSLPIRRPVSSKSQRVTGADPAINLHGFTLRTVDEKGPHRDFVSPDRERMMHTLNVAYFHPQIAMRATGLRNRSRWERHIEVKDGWRVFVRPIRPEDQPAIHGLLRHVTPEDLRLRFFAPMKEFTHQFIARLTQLDYARAMAFVAFDEASNELVGVVHLHSNSIYESGEYAILLRSDLKGRGLGWTLMQLIIEYAKSEGLKVISGDVLQENRTMLQMCRDLGFEVKADPVEPGICNVKLGLAGR